MKFNTIADIFEHRPCAFIDNSFKGVNATYIVQHYDEFGLCKITDDGRLEEHLPSKANKYLILDRNNRIYYLPRNVDPCISCDCLVDVMDNGKLVCYPEGNSITLSKNKIVGSLPQCKKTEVVNRINYRMRLLSWYDLSDYFPNAKINSPGASAFIMEKPCQDKLDVAINTYFAVLQHLCQENCFLAGSPIEMLDDSQLLSLNNIFEDLVNRAKEYINENPDAEYQVWDIASKGVDGAENSSPEIKGKV